jgi:hypothetical protein
MQIHFDETVSLGNVITFFCVIVGLVAFWIRQDERVHAIQKWIEGHEHEAEGRETLIREMGLAIVELRTIAKVAAERRTQ